MTTATPRPIAKSPFSFIWDTWEDRIEIFRIATNPAETSPAPVGWIKIPDVVQIPHKIFAPLYKMALRHPSIADYPLPTLIKTPSPKQVSSERAEPEIIPEKHECTCGSVVTLQFQECSHGTCASCAVSLYHSQIKNRYSYPELFPCPICQAEVRHIGILSAPDSQIYGFGTETEHGVVWNWIPIRRWIALHSSIRKGISARLKGLATGDMRYFVITLHPEDPDSNKRILTASMSKVGELSGFEVEDWVKGWRALVTLCFITISERSIELIQMNSPQA